MSLAIIAFGVSLAFGIIDYTMIILRKVKNHYFYHVCSILSLIAALLLDLYNISELIRIGNLSALLYQNNFSFIFISVIILIALNALNLILYKKKFK